MRGVCRMITRIAIKDVATFDASEHVMQNLGKLNFIFGSNGSGKTTISRVLEKPENYSSCGISWAGNIEIERRVYNSDFVEENFVPETGMRGIFTLGKEESGTKQKIKELEEKLKALEDEKRKTEIIISGEDGKSGKATELTSFRETYINKIWEETKSFRTGSIRDGLVGYLNSKTKFFEMALDQCKKNKVTLSKYDELERRAYTVFAGNHEILEEIPTVNFSRIEKMSDEQILSKKVIGKEDVDIGALIKKLGNSDWVQSGTKYLNDSDGLCPFCQQPLQENFRDQVEEYFDDTYYKKLEDKKRTPSIPIKLENYREIPEKIAELITTANKEIKQHNTMVTNLENEKEKLKQEIWRYVAHALESEIDEYNTEYQKRKKELSNFEQQNNDRTEEIQREKTELSMLQSKLTSVIPMRDEINQQLERFGFSGFRLALGNDEHSYKIIRENGVAAEKTLSEGERNFVAFLYFYALLKGSKDSTGRVPSQIVVIDDPVSSMDSDVLFIVSTLIRSLVWDMSKDNAKICQLFIATHNLYFHKEVSFDRRFPKGMKAETRFWLVGKVGGKSSIEPCEKNPITSTYEALWDTVIRATENPVSTELMSLQNTMRRILEYCSTFYEKNSLDDLPLQFQGDDRIIAKTLVSWLHNGSHSSMDDFNYTPPHSDGTARYLTMFKNVFQKAGHIAHYNMMMRIKEND